MKYYLALTALLLSISAYAEPYFGSTPDGHVISNTPLDRPYMGPPTPFHPGHGGPDQPPGNYTTPPSRETPVTPIPSGGPYSRDTSPFNPDREWFLRDDFRSSFDHFVDAHTRLMDAEVSREAEPLLIDMIREADSLSGRNTDPDWYVLRLFDYDISNARNHIEFLRNREREGRIAFTQLSRETKSKIAKSLTGIDQDEIERIARFMESLPPRPLEEPRIDLSTIPDEPITWYEFVSTGEFRDQIERQMIDLNKIQPVSLKGQYAKDIGMDISRQADQTYGFGDRDEAQLYRIMGQGMLEIATGINPVAGTARSAYEFFIGRDLVTDRELTTAERGFAFAGVLSGGSARYIPRIARGVINTVRNLRHLYRGAETIESAIEQGEGMAPNMHNPMNPGRLDEISASRSHPISEGGPSIASTFRGGSYAARETAPEQSFFRVQDGPYIQGEPVNRFWTVIRPQSGTQSIIDSALRSEWGNRGRYWLEIRPPSGRTYYQGYSAPQGSMVGGGDQVFFEQVPAEWIIRQGRF